MAKLYSYRIASAFFAVLEHDGKHFRLILLFKLLLFFFILNTYGTIIFFILFDGALNKLQKVF